MTPTEPSAKQRLKQALKLVPGLQPAVRFAKVRLEMASLQRKPPEEVFTEIYRTNKWGARDSASGTGSNLIQTNVVRDQLRVICRDFAIQSMLDIPCGDFHWMKEADLQGLDYTGADIVPDLIEKNKKYETSNICFLRLNLIQNKLPKVDLVFCRDCLVHFSFKHILAALRNICDSGSSYLLTTTFTDQKANRDIATGQWRMLNLELPPFSLPAPLRLVNEGCTEHEINYRDKSLGLWRVEDIRELI